MKRISLILIALLIASAATAKNNKHNPSNGFCPPGLAKKTPACVPPGLAKKFAPGSIIPDQNYDWILNPLDFQLPDLAEGEAYVQIGDAFVKVNKETLEILNLYDAIGQVLN